MFFASIASCSLEILINVLLLIEGREDPKFFVNLSYGFYGFGAVVGPIIITWLGLYGPFLIGFCQVLTSFGFLMLPSPEKKNEK